MGRVPERVLVNRKVLCAGGEYEKDHSRGRIRRDFMGAGGA